MKVDKLTHEVIQSLEIGQEITYKNWEILCVPGGFIFQHSITQQALFVSIPGL